MSDKPMQGTPRQYQEWLKTRPECVQQLAAEFEICSQLVVGGRSFWVIGYTESDMLIVTPIDPQTDVDAAIAGKLYFCAQRIRERIPKH